MNYEKTAIRDNFPFKELECQYYDICKQYEPGKCLYESPCAIRQVLRSILEESVAIETQKFQINLITGE